MEMPTPKQRPNPFAAIGLHTDNSDGSPIERIGKKIYVIGMDTDVVGGAEWNDFEVVSGNYDPEKGESRPAIPNGTDYAIIRVVVGNNSKIGGGFLPVPDPEELDLIAFSDMAMSNSWVIRPTLEDINAVLDEIGPERTILAIRFRQPFVLDEASGLREAGAILTTFGANDAALMDVLTSKHSPDGKLPFALAETAAAILRQDSDAPGYFEEDTLFPFGHGLTY